MAPKIHQQTQTNADKPIQKGELAEIPVELQEFIIDTATGIVEMQLQQSLLHRVQCVTSEEAAKLLCVETDTIRDWIKSGKLMASKIGKEWIIRLVEIDKLLKITATVQRMKDKRYNKKFKKAIIKK